VQTTEIFRAELHAEKAQELVEKLKLLARSKKGLAYRNTWKKSWN